MSGNPISSRRSIRKFLEREVPLKLIENILDAGRLAPSAKNRQPWNYLVFGRKQKKELLDCMEQGIAREEHKPALPGSAFGIPDAKNTLRIMREAPIVIIVLNTNGQSPFLPVDSDGRIMEICDSLSIGASVENMLLKAEELGLGAAISWALHKHFMTGKITICDRMDEILKNPSDMCKRTEKLWAGGTRRKMEENQYGGCGSE